MSYPRRILPGTTAMVTRRTVVRTMLLRPDPQLNVAFAYSLGLWSEHFAIDVHQFTVMSNHYHLIVTDTLGQLPDFLREFNRTLALCIKGLRNWDGAVWDHEKPSVVELRTEQAVIETMAYSAANPVVARAVRHAEQWPGLIVLPDQLGRKAWTIKRPDVYFDQDNSQWPETVTLRLRMPQLHMADALVRDAFARELEHLETDAHLTAEAIGVRFLGSRQVLAMSPYERATSREPLRGRNPTFAVGRGQHAAFFEAALVLREFRIAYRRALDIWRTGVRDVLFPLGTWIMRLSHGALVAPS